MRFILVYALFGLLGIANSGYSQEIPEGLKKILNQLQNDPDAEWGLAEAKRSRFVDEDVQMNEFYVDLPIDVYDIDYDKYDTANECMDLEKLIIKVDRWIIPVKVKGQYTYNVKAMKDGDSLYAYACGEGVVGAIGDWDKVRKKYPESTGIRPILIDEGRYKYLHFPNEKDNNLLYLRPNHYKDSLSLTASRSIDSLDVVSTILKYRQEDWRREKRIRYENSLKTQPQLNEKQKGAKNENR